jgi:hypothetical protein
VLESIVHTLVLERRASSGFDDVLIAWRASTATAALAFLDDLAARDAR